MNSHWVQTLVNIAGVLVPVMMWLQRNAKVAKRERNRQHEENQVLLTDIKNEREFLPAHFHMESRGPLSAENIRFRQRRDGV